MISPRSETCDPPSISVIIPVFNEASQISAALTALEAHTRGQNVEVIIADGGSQDETTEIAAGFEFSCLVTGDKANRGYQMNEGARESTGGVLLFLHADVRLPYGAIESVLRAAADERLVGGCFQIRFPDGVPASLRAVAWGINLRTRLFRTATGDQAIFIRRRAFEEIGGYETFPLMEDIALVNKMKRLGQVVVLDSRVEISPRRWLRYGVWRTVLLMYALRLGYWFGVHPAKLKRLFVDVR